MIYRKKHTILVAVILCALIVLPLLVLMISRLSGSFSEARVQRGAQSLPGNDRSMADFDLLQMAERVSQFIDNELADALRKGDVSLDFVARLKKDVERANRAMNVRRYDKARELYLKTIVTIESRLEAIGLTEKAHALNDSIYAKLNELDYLKRVFGKTHQQAVEIYNKALQDLNAGKYKSSIDGYEMAGAILDDLKVRILGRIRRLLETAVAALENYEWLSARNAYNEILLMDPAHADATEGLVAVQALEAVAEDIQLIRSLEVEGKLDEAFVRIEALEAEHPQNPFIRKQRASLQERRLDRQIAGLVKAADEAAATGNLVVAVERVEAAIVLRADPQLERRLEDLKEQVQAAHLEKLLAAGFNTLKAGRYKEARDFYKQAVALAPESKEAATGYEKASSLYLVNIRYTQKLDRAEKSLREGRYPRVAEFFNAAMAVRPNTVPLEQQKAEERLRAEIKFQSVEVPVRIQSDRKTFVSIIGVLPPGKLKTQTLNIFPDVYLVKGSRSGYKPVELELRVDARKQNQLIKVICTEKL